MLKKVKYTEKDIGAEVLYMLSKGLYSEPYHVIREYFQNAIDAFPDNINMTIQNNSIYIFDDGDGMDEHDIDVCRKVGISEKNPDIHVGFRGIGIWAGLIYARKLKISSSKKGVNKKYILTIDFENIVKGIEEKNKEYLTDLLSQYVELQEELEEKNNHFTYIELIDITSNGKKLVEDDIGLKKYLGYTLPVDFPDDFKYKSQVNEQLTINVPGYRLVEIKLNDKPIYKSFPRVDFYPPIVVPIIDDYGEQLGYLWGCLHFHKISGENKELAGLVYKIKGFTIGNAETTNDSWIRVKEPGLRFWYFGEIHIIDNRISPNTARENLEPSDTQRRFILFLDNEIKKLATRARNLSGKTTARNEVKEAKEKLTEFESLPNIRELSIGELYNAKSKADDSIKKLNRKKGEIEKAKLISPKEKKEIKEEIDKQLNSYEKYQKKINNEIIKKDILISKKVQRKPRQLNLLKKNEYDKSIDEIDFLNNQAKKVLQIAIDTIIDVKISKEIIEKFFKLIMKKLNRLKEG